MKSRKLLPKVLSALLSVLMLLSGMLVLNTAAVLPANAAEAPAALQMDAALSKTAITKGESVTIYGTKGAHTGRKFAYYYKKASSESWSTIKSFSLTTSVTLTPAAATAYTVRVDMKDGSGQLLRQTFTLLVRAPLELSAKVSKDRIVLGKSVTLRGTAKGGVEPYQYAYYYKKPGMKSWGRIADYSDEASAVFKPAAQTAYELMVKVKDGAGKIAKKTLSLQVDPALKNLSTISAQSVQKGGVVTLKAAASGGAGGYTYAYLYRSSSAQTWMTLRDYCDVNELNVTMSASGKFTLLLRARDAVGNVKSRQFEVTVSDSGLNAKVDNILRQIIKEEMDDFDKVKAIHDWLVNNVQYDNEGLASGHIPDTSFTAEGLLDTRVAVCDGYAKAFLAMAERSGLEVIRVMGKAANSSGQIESHAWNQVKVDGRWYNVDVTWDDPTVPDGYGDNLRYIYFLIPDSVIDADHFADSVKNTCTDSQPVDRLLPMLKAEAAQQLDNFTFCADDNAFVQAVSSMSGSRTASYTLVYNTDKTSAEIFQMIKDNRPMGAYSMSFSCRGWKLSGYQQVTVTIKVS